MTQDRRENSKPPLRMSLPPVLESRLDHAVRGSENLEWDLCLPGRLMLECVQVSGTRHTSLGILP